MTQTLIRRHVAATHPRGPNPVSTRARTRARRATVPHRQSTGDTARTPAHDWWDWYAAYMDARERGSPRGLPLPPLGATSLRSETPSSRPFDPRTGPVLRPQPAKGVSAQPNQQFCVAPTNLPSARSMRLVIAPPRIGASASAEPDARFWPRSDRADSRRASLPPCTPSLVLRRGGRASLACAIRGSAGADRAANSGAAACAVADANSSTACDEPRSFATIANRCSAVDHVAARGGKPPHSRGRDPSQITFGDCEACASGTRRPGMAIKTVRTRHAAEHGRFTEPRGAINEPRRRPRQLTGRSAHPSNHAGGLSERRADDQCRAPTRPRVRSSLTTSPTQPRRGEGIEPSKRGIAPP
jgi:hypothetical protein